MIKTHYFLVTKESVFKLNEEVNYRLTGGWELLGSPFMGMQSEYCQAMIRSLSPDEYKLWQDL